MASILVFVIISNSFLQSMNFLLDCEFFDEAEWYPMGLLVGFVLRRM